MKLRKGQKVRIVRTGEIATIVEVELIRKGGKLHRYCHLNTGKSPDLWLDSSELGGLTEHGRVTFSNEDGQEIVFDVERDYREEQLRMSITGRNPENLKEHRGIHVLLAVLFMEKFKADSAVLEKQK